MATRRVSIPSKHVELKLVGPRDALLVPRVQRLTANADIPSTSVDELGNSQHVGTSRDMPNVTLTFQAMDVGHKIVSILTGTSMSGYPSAGINITALAKTFDAVGLIKDETVADYIKTMHLRKLTLQTIALNYTVDGDSTEEYTAIGSAKRWFTNDVVVEKFASGSTVFTLAYTPVALKDGSKAISVIRDTNYDTEVSGVPAAGEYRIVTTTLTLGTAITSQVIVVYQANPGGNNWTDVSDLTLPSSIKGKDVPLLIQANSMDRVQSLTINAAFNPTAVREMGNRNIVGYTYPVPDVTGTITVLDTDTQLIRLFTSGGLADTEFQSGFCAATGISLIVKLLDPASCTPPYSVLKTVYLDKITITSDGFTSNVNDNASQTFDWRSETGNLVVYSGAMPG
jgi:hypothetical protein